MGWLGRGGSVPCGFHPFSETSKIAQANSYIDNRSTRKQIEIQKASFWPKLRTGMLHLPARASHMAESQSKGGKQACPI